MSLTTSFPFTTPANYSYPATVEVTADVSQLAIGDNTGQTFNEDFANDGGITYNAANTEFSTDTIRQIQKAYKPTYSPHTFYASLASSINADSGLGSLTGTATGGAAISGGKLDLKYSDLRYVTYGINNALIDDTGCIRCKYTPNYTGIPALTPILFDISSGVNHNNRITLFHQTGTGNLSLRLYSTVGVNILAVESFGVWSPTLGTEYEIEINYDVTAGAIRLFIDGNQFGGTKNDVGVRTTAGLTVLRLGTNYIATVPSNHEIRDVIIFNDVQHTANYVPAAYPVVSEDPIFYATYDTNENANWGDNTLTGTLVNATVAAGQLDCTGGGYKNCRYDNALNGEFETKGCVRMKLTPEYTGSPAGDRYIFTINQAYNSNNNAIEFVHKSDGNLNITLRHSNGALAGTYDFGVWVPTASTEYEIEVDIDATIGLQRVFIDGIKFGGDGTISSSSRDSNVFMFRPGGWVGPVGDSDYYFNDILLFSRPQHWVNYTPDWSNILPYEYAGDIITLPTMTYPGTGNIQAFTNIVSVDANSPRYIMNNLYWSGAAWIASSDTWETANSIADILANIAAYPPSDTIVFKVVFQNGFVQMSADDLTLTYTGQIYDIANPAIMPAATFFIDSFISMTEVATVAGNDTVTYTIEVNGTEYYWDGAAWSVSSGYAQSNTASEINANAASLDCTNGVNARFIAYLHSDDGSTTPILDTVSMTYDPHGPLPSVPAECVVYGYLYGGDGEPIAGATVLVAAGGNYTYNSEIVITKSIVETTTDDLGYFEISVVENANMDAGAYYVFTFSGEGIGVSYNRVVPNQTTENFVNLVAP